MGGNCTCLKCDNCIGITCKEDGCIRSKVVETSCRNLPESFSHIIFAFRDLLERSGMVKPCQAMWSHVSLPRREIFVLCTCYCSIRHFRVGSTGDRRVRGHQERSSVNHGNSWEVMGTHGKREAGPIFCILWSLRHSLKILYPISSYLWSDSYTLRLICKNGRFYGLYEQEKRQKRDTNWYNLVLSCQSFPFDYPNVSIRPALEVDPQQKTSRGRTALAVAKDRWLGGDPWGLGNRWNRSQIWFRDDILQVVPM